MEDDQEIYDDASVASAPAIAPKPNVKRFAAMFEQTNTTAIGTKPLGNDIGCQSRNHSHDSVKKFGVQVPHMNKSIPHLKPVFGDRTNAVGANPQGLADSAQTESSRSPPPFKVALKPTGKKLNTSPALSSEPRANSESKVPTVPKKPGKTVPSSILLPKKMLIIEKTQQDTAGSKTDINTDSSDHMTSVNGKVYKLKDRMCLMGMSKCPNKPLRLDQKLDFSRVIAELKSKGSGGSATSELMDLEQPEQITYEDVAPSRPKVLRQSLDRPVSLIPELTAEEEEDQENYDDVCSPSNDSGIGSVSQDMNTINEFDENDGEELYEPLDEAPDSGSSGQTTRKESERDKKELERLDREDKKREKEKQKKLEKEKKSLQKFKSDGCEAVIMDGEVRETTKGGKLDLAARSGDIVYILRMKNNPPEKFLVKNDEGKYGYMDIINLEIKQSSKDRLKMSLTESMLEAMDDADIDDENIYDETN